MPKDLPGLYWDADKNRYFPLSSRPRAPPPSPVSIASRHQASGGGRAALSTFTPTSTPVHAPASTTTSKSTTAPARLGDGVGERPLKLYSTQRLVQGRYKTECYTDWIRTAHDILCANYACTSRVSRVRIPTLGAIQMFNSTQINGRTWRFIGDEHGWLYSDKDIVHEHRSGMHYWSVDVNLQPSSPISSISISGTRCVSTCLGAGKIAVQDLTAPERMFLLNINGVTDIRASDLKDRTLVLGASKKAVYIADVDSSNSPQYLHTKSDVFSVLQERTLVYTGARNGTIVRFDMRMAPQSSRHGSGSGGGGCQKLFDARFQDAPRSGVLHLSLIRDREMLMSHLNGDLVTFDLRFPTASPLKVFEGHVNRDTLNLGLAVDPDQDFLFAAGQDRRIRAWSLRTAMPLTLFNPPSHTIIPNTNPNLNLQTTANPTSPLLFSPTTTYARPVSALQITEEPGEAGVSLWAASEHDLYQFHLGQRAIPGG